MDNLVLIAYVHLLKVSPWGEQEGARAVQGWVTRERASAKMKPAVLSSGDSEVGALQGRDGHLVQCPGEERSCTT